MPKAQLMESGEADGERRRWRRPRTAEDGDDCGCSRVRDRQNRGGGPRSNGQRRHRWATLSFQGGHLSPYANTHHSDTPVNRPDTLSGVHSGVAQTGGEL